ncbi:MAG: hypothetical protein H0X54_11265 [Propionibacteriales bacterium]|jgi:uncharacterized protein YukE|nr:hypothetical protein [Actinomycetota bacterium]MBA3991593.1 hypothetical protein [Propionibacteriales bacterium]
MTDMQLRADYGMLDQAGGDLDAQAGKVEDYRAALKAEAARALGNFGGGVGSEQHSAAMAMVDQLVDEHINNTRQQRTGVVNANQTFQAAGSRMQSVLGSGA